MRIAEKRSRIGALLLAICTMLTLGGALGGRAFARDYEVRAGTIIRLTMDNFLTSKTAAIGDPFTATVSEDVRAASGEVVIPRGTKVEGRVSSVSPAQRGSKSGTLAIDFTNIRFTNGRTIQVEGQLTSLDAEERRQIDEEGRVSGGSSAKRNVVFIGGGAAGGAAIGAIAGGGKGAGIGAGVGAVVGVLGSVFSKGVEAEVQVGQRFGMELLRPVVLQDSLGGNDRFDDRRDDRRDDRFDDRRDDRSSNDRRDDRRDDRFDDRRDDRRGDPRDDQRTRNDFRGRAADLNSAQMIQRAQTALRDSGYYKGRISGQNDRFTQASIRAFQRDYDLQQTGNLDLETAFNLGLVNEEGAEVLPVRVLNPTAERLNDGSVRVNANAEANSAGWNVYADAQPDGETLKVYVHGVPPARPAGQAITRYPVTLNVRNASTVRKVVFYGDGAPTTVELANPVLELSRSIKLQTQGLIDTYKETNQLGRRGSNDLNVARINESQALILNALTNLNNTASFLEFLVNSRGTDSGVKGAINSLLRETRQTRRLLERNNETRLSRQYADMEQNVRKMTDTYRINYDQQDRDQF